MSESIMQTQKECYLCGKKTCLERHHTLSGVANRKLSEKYGYTCATIAIPDQMALNTIRKRTGS